jgi:NAD(P)-dependent dehydrogenase (short-subunit alcohol dehydrogenase family)
MRLEGRRVLITGTGSDAGQGFAIQQLFAREGARVVGCDIVPGGAERTAEQMVQEGYDVTGMTVDLSDPAAAEGWVRQAAEHLGGIDVLYNNAARAAFAPFGEMTLDLWQRVIRDELDVVFHTLRPAWEFLVDSGRASIINTASLGAIRGLAPLGQAAHAAAKAGVIGLTKTLAAEGAAHGIRANAISPGLVKSAATDRWVVGELREFEIGVHLLRRPGLGEDIAHLALYLASDESSWVTGQNISVDGGATAGFR